MKLLAFGTAISWVLLGAGVPSSGSYIQYGALGLLSFVVVWACTKGFPALLKEQKDDRNLFRDAIDELKTEIRVLKEKIGN